jgi:hypothetical protein
VLQATRRGRGLLHERRCNNHDECWVAASSNCDVFSPSQDRDCNGYQFTIRNLTGFSWMNVAACLASLGKFAARSMLGSEIWYRTSSGLYPWETVCRKVAVSTLLIAFLWSRKWQNIEVCLQPHIISYFLTEITSSRR